MFEEYTEEAPLPDREFYHAFRTYLRRSITPAQKRAIPDYFGLDDVLKEYCRIYAESIGETYEKVHRVATIAGERPSYKITQDMKALYYEIEPREPTRFYYWRS